MLYPKMQKELVAELLGQVGYRSEIRKNCLMGMKGEKFVVGDLTIEGLFFTLRFDVSEDAEMFLQVFEATVQKLGEFDEQPGELPK